MFICPSMRLLPWIYCSFLTALHALYTLVQPSIFSAELPIGERNHTIDADYTETFYLSRKMFAEFARRPLTTWIVDAFNYFDIPLKRSVVLVEYLGVFLTLILLFYLSKRLTKQSTAAYATVFLFASSYWFIHAFFSGIYAYDEPWQYTFLFASLLALSYHRWWLFSGLFLVALIARESTLLLLPGIFFFLIIKKPWFSKVNVATTLKTMWIVPAYGVFLFVIISSLDIAEDSAEYMSNERFKHLRYSFANWPIAIDTVTSFILAIVFPISVLSIRNVMTNKLEDDGWIKAFWMSLILNTIITFTMTLGRETRIFAQPLVLLWPFLGYYFIQFFKLIDNKKPQINIPKTLLAIGLATIAIYIIHLYFLEVFWPTDTRYVTGFQRYGYFTACAALFIAAGVYFIKRYQTPLPFNLGFYLATSILVIYLGNAQIGYKFKPLYAQIDAFIEKHDPNALLIASTNFPHLVESHFIGRTPVFGANLNHRSNYLQMLELIDEHQGNIVFAELEPAVQYPAPYVLSAHKNVSAIEQFGDTRVLLINNTSEHQDAVKFSLNTETNEFSKHDPWDKALHYSGNAEYGPTLKLTKGELGLERLVSYGCRVKIFGSVPENAKLVTHIIDEAGGDSWKGILLSEQDSNKDTTVFYMSEKLKGTWSDSTEIRFFLWNPSQKPMQLGDMEIEINTPFVSELRKKKVAEDILDLK